MSTQPRKRAKLHRDDEERLEDTDRVPENRETTSTSPEAQPAATPSIFGGGEKESSAVERRDGEVAASGSRSGSGDPTPTSTASGVPSGSLERGPEAEERRVECLFSERIVAVLVGPSKTIWRLHENLLSASSDFFKSAFNSGFKETFEDQLTLPEDDPEAFELFVRWLYIRAITPPSTSTSSSTNSTSTSNNSTNPALPFGNNNPPIQTWLRLYALACKLMIEELENSCVDAAWRYYNVGTRRPDIRDVQYIYENTPEGSGMRRLLRERLTLGMFRGRQNNPVTAEWREVLNETPDLGFDIVSEVSGFHWISGGNAPARTGSELCCFHRHEKGVGCRPG